MEQTLILNHKKMAFVKLYKNNAYFKRF